MKLFSRDVFLGLLGIVVTYLLAAEFVVLFFARNDVVIFVWLVFGPATAVVFVLGNRMLLGVLVGALLGFLLSGHDLEAALNGALRHMLVVFVGTWLLRREKDFDPALSSLHDYQKVFAVALSQGLVAAALLEMQDWLGAIPSAFSFSQAFAGVMLSVLIGVPFFLVWRRLPGYWGNAQTALAAILILVSTWLVGQVVFIDWMKDTLGQVARGYWMFLFITWAAVRLGPHGAVLVIASTAIQALVGAELGTGFFSNDIAKTHLANYFFYMLCLSAVGMALATYFEQRRQAMQALNAKVAELDQVNTELARKNEEMESMIYIASHDLRSPLVNIQGFSQRLEKAIDLITTRLAEPDVPEAARAALAKSLGERIPAALGFIRSSSLKMDMLINGLLRLSRAGRAQLAIQPLDMNAMLKDIAGNLTIQTQKAGAVIQVGVLPPCLGDPTQINQVFTNLIDNAIKYRDPSRLLEVRVSGERVGSGVRYGVADTGLGIAADFQPRVWQLFHRLDPNGPVPGEGLGLTLVRRIVERHHGQVTLTSEPGTGSCFTIELPAATSMEPHP
jgi:signal transduction histidine kinase